MKPAPFAYYAPESIAETLALLEQHGSTAKILAGGQSLVPLMNFRLARPEVLIDINRVAGLSGLVEEDGHLVVGAMVRQRTLEASAVARQVTLLLVESTGYIAHLPIRNRGTVGGSLAHADPAAEYPAVALALEAEIVVEGPAGSRRIRACDFFTGYLTTILEPDELLTTVRFPKTSSRGGHAFVEFARRPGDFALVGVAASLGFEPDGTCRTAAIALSGVAEVPLRAAQAEASLEGGPLDRDSIGRAGVLASQEIDPHSDVHASADYRRSLTSVLVPRALATAHDRWQAQAASA